MAYRLVAYQRFAYRFVSGVDGRGSAAVSVVADLHRLQRLSRADPAWTLLRADSGPAVVAMLSRHFSSGSGTRRMAAPELFGLVDADLQALRDEGFDLPRSGQAYCTDWIRAGYLVRRASSAAREETVEPSEGLLAAISYVTGLESSTSTVTESRLTTLSAQLQALARDSDSRAETRLRALHAERAEIDRQIAAVESGDYPVLDGDRAAERVAEILALASEVPGDFARVRAELERLNRDLRARILEDTEDRADTLGEVFRGVDVIGRSDAGRSFSGFYDMIIDPERSARIDEWIDTILDRQFARGLSARQRSRFRRLLTEMEESGAEVHRVMTSLARSLRHFVQSRHYEEHRRMQHELRAAQRAALRAAGHVKPFHQLELELVQVGMTIDSVSALRLHNPGDDRVAGRIETHAPGTADLAALRQLVRESEIDFDELSGNVRTVLAARGRATVAEVLADRPATQGLASVVGLLVLAFDHGHPVPGEDTVTWTSSSGTRRAATVQRRVFTPDEDWT
ncbi:DUF3375 domain-containing protein [Tomitella gaofuii]|uniref:DUF3375 domain-containing protein n=1 Tax=Tomitella gaofuii TaxID=2760083 RepID=UPI0015FC007C|nr:DUF3375 domain-containing protein [Tomitella gaofuii]